MTDCTNAEALRIAYAEVIRYRLKWSPENIGAYAKRIVDALEAKEPSP